MGIMLSIKDALAQAPGMSIEEIETEMHARDRMVQALRDEMAQLHPHWERKNLVKQAQEMALKPGLAQALVPTSLSLGDMSDADLDALIARAEAAKDRKKGRPQ
jgi:hypothetical protein